MRVYYTNEGFVDHATGHYQVAAVDENEPGYAVESTWPTFHEADRQARALNERAGIDALTVARVVASSMGAHNARDDIEVRRKVTDLEHTFPLSRLVAVLSTRLLYIDVPEKDSPAAQFLILVRDAFCRVVSEHLEDGDDLAAATRHAADEADDTLRDCLEPMATTRWEVFIALKAWTQDVSEWDGLGLDLTDLAGMALVETGRMIWAALSEVLDEDTDD